MWCCVGNILNEKKEIHFTATFALTPVSLVGLIVRTNTICVSVVTKNPGQTSGLNVGRSVAFEGARFHFYIAFTERIG
jgi:hypothetical protein